MKFDLRSETFKRKFNLIHFVSNLIIECSKKNRENDLKKLRNLDFNYPWICAIWPSNKWALF